MCNHPFVTWFDAGTNDQFSKRWRELVLSFFYCPPWTFNLFFLSSTRKKKKSNVEPTKATTQTYVTVIVSRKNVHLQPNETKSHSL